MCHFWSFSCKQIPSATVWAQARGFWLHFKFSLFPPSLPRLIHKTSHHNKRWMEKKCVKYIHLTSQTRLNQTVLENQWVTVSPECLWAFSFLHQFGLCRTSPRKRLCTQDVFLCVFAVGTSWAPGRSSLFMCAQSCSMAKSWSPLPESFKHFCQAVRGVVETVDSVARGLGFQSRAV